MFSFKAYKRIANKNLLRSAFQATMTCDIWASIAASRNIRQYSTDSAHSRFRAGLIYGGHQSTLGSNFKSIDNEICSVNDLIDACKTLHLIMENRSLEDKSLKYKDRGFILPKHMRFWYRGHANSAYQLIPTVFRDQELLSREDILIKEFLLQNPREQDTNIFNILALMQHYGYPTRLLDWTNNIMAAAYFACFDEPNNDGMIWILEPFKLNLSNRISKTLGGIALIDDFDAKVRALQSLAFNLSELRSDYANRLHKAKHLPNTEELHSDITLATFYQTLVEVVQSDNKDKQKLIRAIAVEPGCLNERLTAQKGKFTVSGGRYYQEKTNQEDKGYFLEPSHLGQSEEEVRGGYLSNLHIPKKYKAQIRSDLESIIGIDMGAFMLDLNSQAQATIRKLRR